MKREKIVFIMSLIIMSISSIVSALAVSAYLYNSNEVSYNNNKSGLVSSNVQDAIDELHDEATNYTSLNTRVGVLEDRWKNNPTSYFSGNDLRLGVNGASTGGTWLNFYIDGINRGGIGNEANGNMDIAAKDATGSSNTGRLNLLGNPVMVNGKEITSATGLSLTANKGTLAYNSSFVMSKAVFLNFKLSGISSTGVLATIPAGYRPPSETSIMVSTEKNCVCWGWIRTTGEIVVNCSSTLSSDNIRIISHYIYN